MKFGLSPQTVLSINSVFKKYTAIEKAILYGSRAKGNYKNGSDIDLVLLSSDVSHEFMAKILFDLDELLLPYKIDLAFYDDISNDKLKEHIDRVGMIFYRATVLNQN